MRWFTLFLLALAGSRPGWAGSFHAGGNAYRGEAIACDLPPGEHLKNSSGRDGLGLCVFTSIDHAARWANEPALIGFRDFMTEQPGGGWPEKVDEYIPRMAASKGLPVPAFVQHTGGDPEFLKLALKTGRYVSVTYNGRDNVFYSGPIAHMVNLVHFSEQWAVVHDNNFPGKWLWMSPAEFLERWRGSGGGWAVVLLKPGPPPIPVNASATSDSGGKPEAQAREGPILARAAVSGKNRRFVVEQCPPRNGAISPVSVEQCPTRNRAISPEIPPGAELQWRPDAEYPGWFYLYRGTTQIGTWYPDGQGYREVSADGSWSESCEPPAPLPVGAMPNFGLDPQRVSRESRYHINGREVSRREAFAAFGGLADDSGKLRLTIVGDADLRKRVLADLKSHPALTALGNRLLVQDYPPDHWAVAGVGFAPGISLQPPPNEEGKASVLFRMAAYNGPDSLATAVRKADPNYRPDRDPDPAKPAPVPSPTVPFDLSKLPSAAWAAGGLLVAIFLLRRKEKS